MAFDACMMRAVLWDYLENFPEAKIEKVLQPRNDEIDIVIHLGKMSSRLVFNVGPNAPRLQLSSVAKENPPQAPMFCMLLRKYFTGAKIISAEQLDFDRIAVFTVSAYDDMGYLTTKKIVCEIMGKYANLIILDSDDKILAALKVIDFAASTVRQVLPGLKYQIPDKPAKISPVDATERDFYDAYMAFAKDKTVEKFITAAFSGIATQIARELCYRAAGGNDVPLADVSADKLYRVFSEWQGILRTHSYTPTVAFNSEGKPIDFSYMGISYLGSSATVVSYATLGEMFDVYFANKDRIERINQRAKDLITLLNNATARTERKLAIQREALAESEHGEEYKKKGDLITANLYRLKQGMTSFEAEDYYEPDVPVVTVSLDPRLSPAKNAQRMYKLYAKAKNAKKVLTEQISLWEKELIYLESVRAFLDRAETEEDLGEIREELYRSGYSAKLKNYRSPKQLKLKYMTYKTSGGFRLLVGRNNVQNDHLTFKVAAKDDIWFHTKDIPGSHVIMVTDGVEPSLRDYTEAAALAAHYSQATGDRVAVDYTRVKNIRKPQGAKPGFVIYKTNYTAYVKPMSGEEISKNG